MRLDATLVGLVSRDDDPSAHGARSPTSLPGDPGIKPPLAIDAADELVDVHDVRLQFDESSEPVASWKARVSMTPRSA
jgi:hypothetical protein